MSKDKWPQGIKITHWHAKVPHLTGTCVGLNMTYRKNNSFQTAKEHINCFPDKGGSMWGLARARAPYLGGKFPYSAIIIREKRGAKCEIINCAPPYQVLASFTPLFTPLLLSFCMHMQLMPHLINLIPYLCHIYFSLFVNNKIHTID